MLIAQQMVFESAFGGGLQVTQWTEIRLASCMSTNVIKQCGHTIPHFLAKGTLQDFGVRSNVIVQVLGQMECLLAVCKVTLEGEL